MKAKSKFFSKIKSIFFLKKRQGWIFYEEPSLRNFEISETQIIRTIVFLSLLGIVWIMLAFFIGKAEPIQAKKIVFICISIAVLFLCSYIFETQYNNESKSYIFWERYKVRLLSLSLIVPPLLIVYISKFKEQSNIGLICAITFLVFHLLYWSLGLSNTSTEG